MKKQLAFVLLLVVFGCKNERAASVTATAAMTDEKPPSRQFMVAQSPAPPPPGRVPAAPTMPRMIIRTAEVSVIVADTTAAIERLTSAASAAGGYVADSRLWRDHEQLRATLTIRVPAANLDATLAAIRKASSRVQSESIASDDASQEFVDLESQVRNLEAAEVEMRGLMTTVRERTEKAQDILDIYQQLTQLRGQIEQAKGRMRYISQMSAMSTIKVELVPDAVAKPVVEPGWQPVAIAKDASRALVNLLEAVGTAAIWIAIYVLPMIAFIVFIGLILRRLISLRRGASAQS